MNKIGFTGSREGISSPQRLRLINLLFELYPIQEVHFGDNNGADKDFFDIVTKYLEPSIKTGKLVTIGHIPNNDSKRAFCDYDIVWNAKPYLERNRDIVNESDILIACPKEYKEVLRSGTWSTIRFSKKQGKKVIIIYPDGSQIEY